MTTTLERANLLPRIPSFFNEFFDDDTFLGRSWFNKVPAANIIEDDKAFHVELAAPGMTKKDFHIDLDNDMLTISCERKEEKTEAEEHFTRKEFSYNRFKRTFRLPDYVELENVEASYKDGILRVALPKKENEWRAMHKEIAIK